MNELERDRRVDAAWRAASREQPPPEFDAALRAAARRAVDTAPGGGRNRHWWYPLAAAATVAVLAVGIAELTPPERVAPTIADTGASPRESARRQSVAIDAPPPAAHEVSPATIPPAPAPAKVARSVPAGKKTSERPQSASKAVQEQPVVAETSPAQDRLAAGAPESAASNGAPASEAAPPAPTASPRGEPFPGPSPAEARLRLEQAPAESARAGVATEPRQLQRQAAPAAAARADEAKVKDASTRSVEEWIRRIRDLKHEGRTDEAAKELAAFRAAYGERADALLPADLQPGKR